MTAPNVTPLYAALLAVLYLALAYRVIARRNAARVTLGSGGDPALERAIRVHANFAEYVPFALLLMLLAEFGPAPRWALHLLGVALVAGRLSHAIGVARQPEDLRFRIAGVAATLTAIALLAGGALATAFAAG